MVDCAKRCTWVSWDLLDNSIQVGGVTKVPADGTGPSANVIDKLKKAVEKSNKAKLARVEDCRDCKCDDPMPGSFKQITDPQTKAPFQKKINVTAHWKETFQGDQGKTTVKYTAKGTAVLKKMSASTECYFEDIEEDVSFDFPEFDAQLIVGESVLSNEELASILTTLEGRPRARRQLQRVDTQESDAIR